MMTERHRIAVIGIAGMVLQRAVEDCALGIRAGLLCPETLRVLRRAKMASVKRPRAGANHKNDASNPLEHDCCSAALFLLDWRARHLCDIISTLSPRTPVSPAFLRRSAARMASLPENSTRSFDGRHLGERIHRIVTGSEAGHDEP